MEAHLLYSRPPYVKMVWLLTLGVLLLFGLIATYTAAPTAVFFFRKGLHVLLGISLFIGFRYLPPHYYLRYAVHAYLLNIALLILVLVVGAKTNGASRWLKILSLRFQPSELSKLTTPLILAQYIGKTPLPPRFFNVLISLGIVLLPTFLIALQPDLGTAILISSTGLFTLFLAGINWRYVVYAAGAFLVSLPLLWHHWLHEYQRNRIKMLLNPSQDSFGTGYHIIQSKIAIGSGGWRGKGLGQGTQTQLSFLPERHTDFIFSVIAEETGFIGSISLLGTYLLFFILCFQLAKQMGSCTFRLLAGSITFSCIMYTFVNIGMVSGLFPVVGVPLPFMSYGGSALVLQMVSFGMLLGMAEDKRWKTNRL